MLKDEVTILKDYDKVLLKGKDTGLIITKVVTNLTYPFKVCYFPCKNVMKLFLKHGKRFPSVQIIKTYYTL